MNYISYIVLIITFIIDFIFYVPLIMHCYIDEKRIYMYLYTIPIIVIDKEKKINKLKNKVSLEKLLSASKEDFKIVESFAIKRIIIALNKFKAYEYANIIYPLISIDYLSNRFDFKIENNFKSYIKVSVNLVNIIFKLLSIRRLKNERTSN